MVVWTQECEIAFQKLKSLLTSSPIVSAPDYSLPFVIQTDASEIGLGVVLSQVVMGVEHPICFLSRQLLSREKNYSTIEKECLAIVWGIQMLDSYLFGRKFTVQTDHNPIRWLNSSILSISFIVEALRMRTPMRYHVYICSQVYFFIGDYIVSELALVLDWLLLSWYRMYVCLSCVYISPVITNHVSS